MYFKILSGQQRNEGLDTILVKVHEGLHVQQMLFVMM